MLSHGIQGEIPDVHESFTNFGWSCRRGVGFWRSMSCMNIVTRYDTETLECGLFAGYIDTFLKLKTEASGYPVLV